MAKDQVEAEWNGSYYKVGGVSPRVRREVV